MDKALVQNSTRQPPAKQHHIGRKEMENHKQVRAGQQTKVEGSFPED